MLYLTSTSETVAQLRKRDYNLSVKVQSTTVAQKERMVICYNVPREFGVWPRTGLGTKTYDAMEAQLEVA